MIWGRLEDWDDGVTATRSEPRAKRRTLYFGATQAGSLLASTTAEQVGGGYLLISLSRSRDRSASDSG